MNEKIKFDYFYGKEATEETSFRKDREQSASV